MKKSAAAVCAAGIVFANPLPGLAQDVLTTHRLEACAKAGVEKISGRLK